MRRCPYCQEEIHDDAIKCRWCGEFIKRKSKALGCLYGCLMWILGSIIALLIMGYFFRFMIDAAMYKLMALRASFPGYSIKTPFNPVNGLQDAYGNMSQGYQIMKEFLGEGELSSYERIYPPENNGK